MISQIRGTLVEKQAPAVIVDLQGLGYEVLVPVSSFAALPECGEALTLFTELIVREDAHTLYGFISKSERRLFQTLLKVNGVGAKMALGILSAMAPERFVQCIQTRDIGALTKLPGIGKKTAERLIIELSDRIADWGAGGAAMPVNAISDASLVEDEAQAALQALGYRQAEAQKNIRAALKQGAFDSSEALIRAALQLSAR